jgi:DNA-binding NtrC family response regulator
MMAKHSIVIVDDEQALGEGLRDVLAAQFPGLAVFAFTNPDQALAMILDEPVSMVFTDLRMPVMDGMELLARIKKLDPAASVVVMTAFGSIENAVEAVKRGAFDFVCKPFVYEAIFKIVQIGLERSDLIRENITLKRRISDRVSFANFVGQSGPMRRFYDQLQAVARTGYTVLIRGESGTGKELTAKAIHNLSPRKDAPLVMINCPAIPEHLLESELFGHAKGAFTGADANRPGLFEEANQGTICLDEIGDIPLSVQIKLLRVLQEGEIRPVGSTKTRKINTRVIAATNQDLERKIKDGSFRSDLFYRLNVVTIWTPTLHDIIEDIPLLANHFTQLACSEQNLPLKKLTADAMITLAKRSWPGNIRELQNCIRRAVLFCHEEMIGPEYLLSSGRPLSSGTVRPVAVPPELGPLLPYKQAKDEVMGQFSRSYLAALLGATNGNVSRAATLSTLTRAALQKIMRRYAIQADDFRGGGGGDGA